MDAYTSFAEVYDLFMSDIPYKEWGAYLKQCLLEQGIKQGIILDLGCGTGNITTYLASQGYDMIGIDASEDMLQIAMEKQRWSSHQILYLLQDMREFELYGTVNAVVSICDSINYILETEELLEVFRLVDNYLDPGGVFIFDFNTNYKYETILGDSTIAENREESSFIWNNYYDSTSRINEYDLTLFIREGEYYKKYEEIHYQKGYTLCEVQGAIEKAGLTFVVAYDAFTKEMPHERSERIYVVAKECKKGKKL